MKLLGSILAFLLALAILAGLGAGVYFVVDYVARRLSELDAGWTNLIIAVCTCVLVVGCVTVAAARALGRYQHLYRSRLEQTKVYERFLTAIADPLTADAGAAGIESLRAAEREMIVLASSRVLQKYDQLQDSLAEQDGTEPVPNSIDKLLKEIRSDLGLAAFGFEEFQLNRLLLRTPLDSAAKEDVANSTFHSGVDPDRASETENEVVYHRA